MASTGRREIECLACGTVRLVEGQAGEETGECPRCGYLGWASVADLDAETSALILSGLLARPPKPAAQRGSLGAAVSGAHCPWRRPGARRRAV